MQQRRSKAPVVTASGPLAAAIALALSGCADPEPVRADTTVACVERSTMMRVPDEQCPQADDVDGDDAFFLYYYPYGTLTHPVGAHVSGGSHLRPAGAKTAVKAPPAGGKVYSVPGGKTGGGGGKGGFGTTGGNSGG